MFLVDFIFLMQSGQKSNPFTCVVQSRQGILLQVINRFLKSIVFTLVPIGISHRNCASFLKSPQKVHLFASGTGGTNFIMFSLLIVFQSLYQLVNLFSPIYARHTTKNSHKANCANTVACQMIATRF